MKKLATIRIVIASLFLGLCTFTLTTVLCQRAMAGIAICDCCTGVYPSCGKCGVWEGNTCLTSPDSCTSYAYGAQTPSGTCTNPNGCCVGIMKHL